MAHQDVPQIRCARAQHRSAPPRAADWVAGCRGTVLACWVRASFSLLLDL